jgi:ubiquinone/menaquinone biosynthesis C-methylase UbiE
LNLKFFFGDNVEGFTKVKELSAATTQLDIIGVSNSGQAFDSDEFKAQQHQIWDNVAARWQAWWPMLERGAQEVSDKIVELSEIKPGDRVLDIATGIGEPAVTAARKVMPNGKVVATDISP